MLATISLDEKDQLGTDLLDASTRSDREAFHALSAQLAILLSESSVETLTREAGWIGCVLSVLHTSSRARLFQTLDADRYRVVRAAHRAYVRGE